MDKLSFFTPIAYNDNSRVGGSSVLEKIDSYFSLGGKKAYVIKSGSNEAVLVDEKNSLAAKVVKIFSYLIIIIPLFLLIAKAILRSKHTFKLIDPKTELESTINLKQEILDKIQQVAKSLMQNKEVIWLAKGRNLVFKIQDVPDLVFKRVPAYRDVEQHTEERYANMIKAKAICLAHNLHLLQIPHAKKIDINLDGYKYILIAEECLDINSKESAQQELYKKHTQELDEVARQLAIFIAKTGFNYVTWRNIPLTNNTPKRVALIDIKSMKNAENGFLGDTIRSCGLIRCLFSEKQIDMVINEARKQGVKFDDSRVRKIKALRLEEIETAQRLENFHQKKEIKTGKEIIQVDLETLGLDLNAKEELDMPSEINSDQWVKELITLREVAEFVIDEINKLIQKKSDDESVNGKRRIVVNDSYLPFSRYKFLGLPPTVTIQSCTDEQEAQMWIPRILTSLVEKGYIFQHKRSPYGFEIQA